MADVENLEGGASQSIKSTIDREIFGAKIVRSLIFAWFHFRRYDYSMKIGIQVEFLYTYVSIIVITWYTFINSSGKTFHRFNFRH